MKTKLCTICRVPKSLHEFNKKRRSTDGLQNICRDCSSDRSRTYYAENREHHKKVTMARTNRHRKKAKDYLQSIKKLNGCALCPEKTHCCLDFHHLRDKVFELARSGEFSMLKIQEELAKCVCLCANCHRKVHNGLLHVNNSYRCKTLPLSLK